MTYIYLLFLGFLLTATLTKITILIANQKQIIDANDQRKIHTETVSALGGIPIFIGCSLMLLLFDYSFSNSIYLCLGASILFLVGIEDDLKNAKIIKRLLAQVLAGSLAFMGGFHFGWESILLDYGTTIFFIILLINSFNFIDGINGLAGGLGAITMLIFSGLLYQNQLFNLAILAITYGTAIVGFLVFNFGNKADIFMGDNGSTVLGFMVSIFALQLFQLPASSTLFTTLPIVLVLLSIPILDTIYVTLARISKGKSPCAGDRNHIHHLLTDRGRSHTWACGFIGIWLTSLLAFFSLVTTLSFFATLLVIFISYAIVRVYFTTKFSVTKVIWQIHVKLSKTL